MLPGVDNPLHTQPLRQDAIDKVRILALEARIPEAAEQDLALGHVAERLGWDPLRFAVALACTNQPVLKACAGLAAEQCECTYCNGSS